MSVFHPIFRFHRIYEIQPEWLREYGISVLLLDVDNTLTTHDNPDVPNEVRSWIERMRAAKIRLMILSNNNQERVEPFAQKLGIGCIANAKKPLGDGVRRTREALGVSNGEIAIVGDQIFTDVLCANLAGVWSVLVEPMELESFPFFKVKRALERVVLKDYHGDDAGAKAARVRRFYEKRRDFKKNERRKISLGTACKRQRRRKKAS